MAQSDIDIVFPKADVKALFAGMARAERELGASLGGGVRMAGFQLSRTMGTSTKVAPKKRPYRVISKRRARGDRPASMLIEVDGYRNGKPVTYKAIVEGGKRDANKSPFVRIGMTGLAKSSWSAAAQEAKTGSAVSRAGVSRSAKEWGSRYGSGGSRYKGDDPFFTITSFLPYIERAMIPGAANTAMERAARGLDHWIDKRLATLAKKAAAS